MLELLIYFLINNSFIFYIIRVRFYRAFESLKIVGVIADAKGRKGYVRKMIWGTL